MGVQDVQHPIETFIRAELLPSVWCPGCGMGITVNAFLKAVLKGRIDPRNIRIVTSGIGCTGRVADYLLFKQISAPPERLFSTAAAVEADEPGASVVVFLSDVHFILSGVEGLLQAAREGRRLAVIYFNSYIYHLLVESKKTRPAGTGIHYDSDSAGSPFNLPLQLSRTEAAFISRWTPLHVWRVTDSIREALTAPGLAFVEIISPCLMQIASEEGLGWKIDRMGTLYSDTEIRNEPPSEAMNTRDNTKIVIGRFFNRQS